MPPILCTSYCKFNGARSCAHARKIIPLVSIHSFTRQIVPSLYQQSSTWASLQSIILLFHMRPITPSFHQYFYAGVISSLFVSLFHFITHFSWTFGNPESILSNSLFVHSLLYQTTHITLTKLVSALPEWCQYAISDCALNSNCEWLDGWALTYKCL